MVMHSEAETKKAGFENVRRALRHLHQQSRRGSKTYRFHTSGRALACNLTIVHGNVFVVEKTRTLLYLPFPVSLPMPSIESIEVRLMFGLSTFL